MTQDNVPNERVGIRELKAQASEIVRRVRDDGVSFDISLRGDVVARIMPAEAPRRSPAERQAYWDRYQTLLARAEAARLYRVER